MKYLCLIYNEEKKMDVTPAGVREMLASEALAYDEELRRKGHFVAAEALQPSHMAATVRVRNGRLSTTEGPVPNAKEQLDGFILIEARDLNEAIRVASKMPEARFGSIEVRPVKDSE